MEVNEVQTKDEFSDWESRITDELFNVDEALELNLTTDEDEKSDEEEFE